MFQRISGADNLLLSLNLNLPRAQNISSLISVLVTLEGLEVYGWEKSPPIRHIWAGGSPIPNHIIDDNWMDKTGMVLYSQAYVDNLRIADLSKSI